MGHRIVMHIDINSAFLSMEAAYRLQQGEDLDIRTVPCVIGGNEKSRHGIVLAKSNSAKKLGVKTGEPLWQARLKCPNLLVIHPSYQLYVKASRAFISLLETFSPIVEQFSVDEAWIDYTGMEKNFGDCVEKALEIKEAIKKNLGFTVSIGVSSNKLLSKVASDLKKPDAVSTLFPHEMKEKLWPLPVEDMFMVGPRTKKKLNKMGVYNVGQLAALEPDFLYSKFKSYGLLIHSYANGREESPVRPGQRFEMKGMGNSYTSRVDLTDRASALLFMKSLINTLCTRLRDAGVMARVFSLSIKTSTFDYYSHQRKVLTATSITREVAAIFEVLFDECWNGEPLRHIGVSCTELYGECNYQISLFDNEKRDKEKALDKTIDRIREKYGVDAVYTANFLKSGFSPLNGGYPQEDYPPMSSLL